MNNHCIENISIEAAATHLATRSPFTGHLQRQGAGGQWWEAVVAFQPMSVKDAGELFAGLATFDKAVQLGPRGFGAENLQFAKCNCGTARRAVAQGTQTKNATRYLLIRSDGTLEKGDWLSTPQHNLYRVVRGIASSQVGSPVAVQLFPLPRFGEDLSNAVLELVAPRGWFYLSSTRLPLKHNVTLRAQSLALPFVEKVYLKANEPPSIVAPLKKRDIITGSDDELINLYSVFSDRDGDTLSFKATSQNSEVVDATISGAILRLAWRSSGKTQVVLEAVDNGAPQRRARLILNVEISSNRTPSIVKRIADQAFSDTAVASTFNLNDVFTDPDGHALTFAAVSSQKSVVTAKVLNNALKIKPVKSGSATVTVTATDQGTPVRSVIHNFNVNVRNTPPTSTAFQPLVLARGEVRKLDVSAYFNDGVDSLNYGVISSNQAITTATLEGSILSLEGANYGASSITVGAFDDGAPPASARESFSVRVENLAPRLSRPLNFVSVEPNVSFTLNLNDYFSDPYDSIAYAAKSSDTSLLTVAVNNETLTGTALAFGSATVTITATDNGTPIKSSEGILKVKVQNNVAPTSSPMPFMDMRTLATPTQVDLSSYFSDPGDLLTYTATSADSSIANATISGHNLLITPGYFGRTSLSITATDDASTPLSVSENMNVLVRRSTLALTGISTSLLEFSNPSALVSPFRPYIKNISQPHPTNSSKRVTPVQFYWINLSGGAVPDVGYGFTITSVWGADPRDTDTLFTGELSIKIWYGSAPNEVNIGEFIWQPNIQSKTVPVFIPGGYNLDYIYFQMDYTRYATLCRNGSCPANPYNSVPSGFGMILSAGKV